MDNEITLRIPVAIDELGNVDSRLLGVGQDGITRFHDPIEEAKNLTSYLRGAHRCCYIVIAKIPLPSSAVIPEVPGTGKEIP